MAFGKLVVPVVATTGGFARGLAQSSRMADAWALKIGGRLDKAFAGLGRSGGPLGSVAAGIQSLGRLTALAKTATDTADVARAAGWARVGWLRFGSALAGSKEKADAMRASASRLSGGLRIMRDASEKARFGLFAADLGLAAGKAGVLIGRAFPGMAAGLGRTAAGFVAMAAGAGLAVRGVVGFVPNVARMTRSLASAVFVQRGAAARAHEFGKSLFYAYRAAGPIRGVGAVLAGVAKAGGGLAGVGLSLVKLPLRAVASGAGVLARGLGGALSASLSVAAGLAKVGVVAGALAGIFGVKAAASAAHLEETYNKTRQVFGDHAAEVLKSAKAMEDGFGVNPQPFLDGATAVGSMLKGMGYAQGDAAKLGTNFAKLAADSKAFRDVGLDVALQKVRSGLSGESEPLKEFGIIIDEGALKAYGLAEGMIRVGEEMTASQKVQARVALITRGLKDDMGALAREADGPAAQMAEFSGRIQTLMDTIGASLAPVLGSALQGINTGLVALTIAWEDGKDAVMGWFGLTNEAVGGATGGVGVLQRSVEWVADAWGIVRGATASVFSYMETGLSKLSGWIAAVFEALGNLPGAGDWTRNTAAFLREYSESAGVVADELRKSADDAFSGKNLGSNKVGEYFERAADRIKSAREAASKPLDFNAAAPDDPGGAKKKKEKTGKGESPFSEAFELGSAGALSIEMRHLSGGSNPTAKAQMKTAENTSRMAKGIQRLNDRLTASSVEVRGIV